MITPAVLQHIEPAGARGLIVAAGGAADIILARTLADALHHAGSARVDIAQPLNCAALSKGLRAQAGEEHALVADDELEPELVLRHNATVPARQHPDDKRGKGLFISSSLAWSGGARYVCAAHGGGPAQLAARRDRSGAPFYDFAVAVDGGGDVLTHGDAEFDRVVVGDLARGWGAQRPLLLVAVGLGADGGSTPEQFCGATLKGWTALDRVAVDQAFAGALQAALEPLALWHPNPASWRANDREWGYGLKVPQIIALAVRGEFPFGGPADDPDRVWFPRRGALRPMSRRLLCEARLFLYDAGERWTQR